MNNPPSNLMSFMPCSLTQPREGFWLVMYERGPLNGKGRSVPNWYVEAEGLLSDFRDDPTEIQRQGGYLYRERTRSDAGRVIILEFQGYQNWGEA